MYIDFTDCTLDILCNFRPNELMTEEDRLKILKYLAESNVDPHENQNSNELSVTEAGRFIVTPATQRKRPPTARRDSSNDSEPYEVIEVKAELHTDETYVLLLAAW